MKAVFANSFDPERVEKIAIELYGDEAVTAVAYCALQRKSSNVNRTLIPKLALQYP